MAKATILDRLAGAMKTLSKREGKALTPRQRVAAAQHWNSLADIGEDYIDNFAWKLSNDEAKRWHDAVKDANQIGILEGQMYDYRRADNPFLSDNIDKYAEQSDFLDWCRYNRVEPNARSLKQFRWETYKTLPYRQQQWIANKRDIPEMASDEGFLSQYDYPEDIHTLQDFEDATSNTPYDFMGLPIFKSMDEFPDDFNYMWRY